MRSGIGHRLPNICLSFRFVLIVLPHTLGLCVLTGCQCFLSSSFAGRHI